VFRDTRLWIRPSGKGRYDGAVPEEALHHEPPPPPAKEPPRWRCAEHGLVEDPLFLGNVPYCYWLTCDRQLEDLRPPARATRAKGARLRVVQGGRRRAPEPSARVVHAVQPREEAVAELEVDDAPPLAPEAVQPTVPAQEVTVPKSTAETYPRGALQEQLLAQLAAAPERTMSYDALAEALWPGVERSVSGPRLNNALNRAARKGHVRRGDGSATLLISAQMPPSMAASAESVYSRRQRVQRDQAAANIAKQSKRSGGSPSVLVDPLRAALQGQIERLQALLRSLDDVEAALKDAAA